MIRIDEYNYNEMTPEEIKKEIRIQKWVLWNWTIMQTIVERKIRTSDWRMDNLSDKEKGEEYINGIIDEKEYKVRRQKINANRNRLLYCRGLWEDRLAYTKTMIRELELLVEEMEEAAEKRATKIKNEKHRIEMANVRHRPKSYKYDPRKNISKNNRPRKK